jgi:hypothetical protein
MAAWLQKMPAKHRHAIKKIRIRWYPLPFPSKRGALADITRHKTRLLEDAGVKLEKGTIWTCFRAEGDGVIWTNELGEHEKALIN